jgi:hypothetical protein
MAAPRPTWRNYIRGLKAEAAMDVPAVRSKLEEPYVPRGRDRALATDTTKQLSLLELPKATVARLTVDRQAHVACADNLDFMRSLKTGSMKLIVTSPPYNTGKS